MLYKKQHFLNDVKEGRHWGCGSYSALLALTDGTRAAEGDRAYETDLNVEMIYTGSKWKAAGQPIVALSVADTTNTADAAKDITGTSLSLPSGYFTSGKALHWFISGTRSTGTNGALTITLYVDDADQLTLTFPANTSVDFTAEIWLIATGAATQKMHGVLWQETEDCHTIDGTDTTNFSDGAATTVKCRMKHAHANDVATISFAYVELIDL